MSQKDGRGGALSLLTSSCRRRSFCFSSWDQLDSAVFSHSQCSDELTPDIPHDLFHQVTAWITTEALKAPPTSRIKYVKEKWDVNWKPEPPSKQTSTHF